MPAWVSEAGDDESLSNVIHREAGVSFIHDRKASSAQPGILSRGAAEMFCSRDRVACLFISVSFRPASWAESPSLLEIFVVEKRLGNRPGFSCAFCILLSYAANIYTFETESHIRVQLSDVSQHDSL